MDLPEGAASLLAKLGGEEGIRTLVPAYTDHLISSQRRYDHFGTSPGGRLSCVCCAAVYFNKDCIGLGGAGNGNSDLFFCLLTRWTRAQIFLMVQSVSGCPRQRFATEPPWRRCSAQCSRRSNSSCCQPRLASGAYPPHWAHRE